jgi:hypothetical protein
MHPRIAAMYARYDEGASLREVGREFGLTGERVRQLFAQHGLATRSRLEAKALGRAEREAARSAQREEKRKRRRPVADWIEKKYSDEELLQILRDANDALGGILTASAYNEFAKDKNFPDGRPWPTHQTHFHRFGSWREALLAAGLSANPSSAIAGQRLFDRGHCIDAIRHAYRELDAVPSISEYESIARAFHGALPSAATIRTRCGSWTRALRMAELS